MRLNLMHQNEPEWLTEALFLRSQGLSIDEVAKELGRPSNLVRRHCADEDGVAKTSYRSDEVAEILKLHAQGRSIPEIAHETGAPGSAIKTLIHYSAHNGSPVVKAAFYETVFLELHEEATRQQSSLSYTINKALAYYLEALRRYRRLGAGNKEPNVGEYMDDPSSWSPDVRHRPRISVHNS